MTAPLQPAGRSRKGEDGRVAERLMAPVSKTDDARASVGSNPTPSAIRLKSPKGSPPITATFVCFWCGGELPAKLRTYDHLLPQWAMKIIRPIIDLPDVTPERAERAQRFKRLSPKVAACERCNLDKGPMPPALYWRVRHDLKARTKERYIWSKHALRASRGDHNLNTRRGKALLVLILSAMSEEFPHNGVRAQEYRPWKR